jgi:hypothetical protein
VLQKYVVIVAAWLEIVVGALGALILLASDVSAMLLSGAKPEGIGISIARFAGIALIALGIAFLPARAGLRPNSLLGLFVFNVGAAILFAWVAVTTQHGPLTWPGAIRHAGIAVLLTPQLLKKGSLA